MPTRNVNLTNHFAAFIDSGIETGRYSNASEVVREGLRLLEQRDREDAAKIDWLRGAAQDAIDSVKRGEGRRFHSMDELDAYVQGIADEVTQTSHVSKVGA